MQFSKKSFKFQFEIISDSAAGNSLQKAAKHGEAWLKTLATHMLV